MITHAGMNDDGMCEEWSTDGGDPGCQWPAGVAARIAWTGAVSLSPQQIVPRLRDAIKQVLTEESYKQNALRLQAATLRAGGVTRAADIIEQAIFTGKPVLAQTQQ